jgi:hypothetical protein
MKVLLKNHVRAFLPDPPSTHQDLGLGGASIYILGFDFVVAFHSWIMGFAADPRNEISATRRIKF